MHSNSAPKQQKSGATDSHRHIRKNRAMSQPIATDKKTDKKKTGAVASIGLFYCVLIALLQQA